MAFSSGTYSLYTPGNPVVTGTTIASDWANNTLNDIATALSTCVLKDGSQTITANIPMGGFKFTGLAAGTANGNSVRYEQSPAGILTTTGDTLYASSANTPARLGIGTARQTLATNSGATAPEWVASLQSLMTTTGDVVYASSANTPTRLAIGTAGQVLTPNAAATGFRYVSALNKAIYGLTYANGTDATNDIDIAVGGAMDSTGAYWMTLGSALTKQLDANWAVGTNQGMRNSAAAITDTGYYIWLVARSDTGVVDVYAHTSATAATVLTALQAETGGSAYDYLRLIGWIKRESGAIAAFTIYETEGGGLELSWNAPTLDVNLANTLTTSRRTDAVRVPLLFSTIAHLNVEIKDGTSAALIWICCPDQTDAAPADGTAPLFNVSSLTGYTPGLQMKVRTSATGTVAARATIATVDLYAVSTMGFTWARRN